MSVWTCRKCKHANERTRSQVCAGCGRKTKPVRRKPAHTHALDLSYNHYVTLNEQVHGVDELTCALCGGPRKGDIRLDRDHAHFDGGYPRGLLHSMCNKKLGEIERGRDGIEWMQAAIAYLERANAHQAEAAA